jgi:MFS family permease
MGGERSVPAVTERPARDAAARIWVPGQRLLTVGLIATITLFAFESLAVATVMPLVEEDLGDLWLYGWVFSGFFLGQVLGIVVAGWWCDRAAPSRPFTVGVVLFVAGLLVSGAAGSMHVLVGGRVLQGLGAGAIPAVAYVCIARGYPEGCRPRMFALLSTAWVVPAVLGPGLSGVVGEAAGWRAVFLGLVPIVVVSAAVAIAGIRSLPAGDRAGAATVPLPRAVQVTAAAAMVVGGLNTEEPVIALPLVAAGLMIGLPAFRALTPPGTLHARAGLPAAIAARGIITFAFFGAETFVPLALDELRGLSPAVAGAALTLSALAWTSGSWVQERTVERIGPRRLVRAGNVLLLVGVGGVVVGLAGAVPVAVIYLAWMFAGLGMGLSFAPQSIVVLGEADPGAEGRATSSLQLCDTLGVALGTGTAGAIVAAGDGAGWELRPTLQGVFLLSAAVAAVGVLVAGRLPEQMVRGRVEDHLTTAVTPASSTP